MNIKDVLNKNNFVFKKKFGQNFLKDDNILNNIVKVADIEPNSLIIEIGIGAAALTKKLASTNNQVLGYEIDLTLKDVLTEVLYDYNNIDIIYDDFLKRNIKSDIEKYSYNKLYVVANLPYYITTPIITKFIEENIEPEKIVVMVQNEVADRFSAKINTKDYNSLTLFLNYYFDIKKEFFVSRNVFYPIPNVDSAVISFTKKEEKAFVTDEKKLFRFIKDAFTQKRKNLRNNLKNYDLNLLEDILSKINKNLTDRAESLTLDDYIFIINNLDKQ